MRTVRGSKKTKKSPKRVRRSRNQGYTALVHGRRFNRSKPKKPYYDEFGFMHDKYGRIIGTYFDY